MVVDKRDDAVTCDCACRDSWYAETRNYCPVAWHIPFYKTKKRLLQKSFRAIEIKYDIFLDKSSKMLYYKIRVLSRLMKWII
jgi:hypothetical protein